MQDTPPHHAGFVGAFANIHAPAHKNLSLIALQRQGSSLGHGRVCCGEIILQRHGHTACKVVQHRDAVQTHSQIEINVFPLQQAGHCITGIAAAFLLAIAKAMGKADLHLSGAHRIAQHTRRRTLRRRIYGMRGIGKQQKPDSRRRFIHIRAEKRTPSAKKDDAKGIG